VRFKKLICSLLVVFLFGNMLPVMVSAADVSVSVSQCAADKSIVLRGSGRGSVSITIIADGIEPEAASDGDVVYFDIVSCNSGNSYDSGEFYVTPSASAGKYNVYVTDSEGGVGSAPLILAASEISDSLLSDVNSAQSYSALRSLIEQNYEEFGINSSASDYITYSDKAYRIMYAMSKTYTADKCGAVRDDFYAALAMAKLGAAAPADAGRILSGSSAELGFGHFAYSADPRLDSVAISELYSLLASADYVAQFASDVQKGNDASFIDYYYKLELLAAVRSTQNWQELYDVLTDTFAAECAFINNADYNSLSSKDDVFIEMSKKTYNKYEDIESEFAKAVALAKKNAENTNPGKDFSGSGSTGSSVSFPANPSVIAPTDVPQFHDLPQSHWSYENVMELCKKNVIAGYEDGSFRPDNPVTRAEYVKLIVTAFGHITASGASFSDVDETDWYYPYISAACNAGIVLGNPDGSFCPDDRISRQDAAVMLYRALGRNVEYNSGLSLSFADSQLIADYCLEAVSALSSRGIINGDDTGAFRPLGQTKRSEAAKMISCTIALAGVR